jgi:hypothetical protein
MPTPLASSVGTTTNSAATTLSQSNFGKTVDDINVNTRSIGSGLRPSTTNPGSALNAGYTAKFNAKNTELKRIWQSVLRECHRSDPDRCGQVSRNVFISALEKSDLDKVSSWPATRRALWFIISFCAFSLSWYRRCPLKP